MAVCAKIIDDGLKFWRFQIAWQRLNDVQVFIQKYRCGETKPVIEPMCGQLMVSAGTIGHKFVGFPIQTYVLMLLCIEFDRVEIVVQVLDYGWIGKGR